MRIYIVGGAVRDELLGRPVADRDYVVVGATPEDLLARGFRPVGRDFPVFLHPETQAEYALARTERKSGHGYHGFTFHTAPNVRLEDDLARRDLTINAMARSETGELIDPYGGRADLAARLLRHVGPAFAEDPVRILRLARFAARFADFRVAPETLALMRTMVESGEVDHLVPERVWQELARGLMEHAPGRMIEVLRACGALARLLPEVEALFGVPQRAEYHPEIDSGAHVLLVLGAAARLGLSLAGRFAALTHDLGKGNTPPSEWPRHHAHEARGVPILDTLCARLRVPADCRDLARLMVLQHGKLHGAGALRPATMVRVMETCDVHRRPARFAELLLACQADHLGRLGAAAAPYPQAELWQRAAGAFRSIDAGAVARACATPAQIPAALHQARVAAVRAALGSAATP